MTEGTSHPWLVTGPWYRWAAPADPAAGALSAPAIQKFGSADFVNRFIDNPQRSLLELGEDWLLNGREAGAPGTVVSPTDLLKMYLPTHGRHYLVVVEVRCDAPGLPSVARNAVLSAGFVVRRSRIAVPLAARASLASEVAKLGRTRATLRRVRSLREPAALGKQSRINQLFAASLGRGLEGGELALLRTETEARQRLLALLEESGAQRIVEAWRSGEGVGQWQPLSEAEETPEEIEEAVYPLFPLVPDPGHRNHSSAGKTLWFGVIPAASAEVSSDGLPRFDGTASYHVRCFVKRDKHGKSGFASGECTEAFWSEATRSYQLANAADSIGTSNRPVTVELPDLAQLRDQIARLRVGDGFGLCLLTPPASELQFTTGSGENVSVQGPSVGAGGAICFFFIPLITIVAFFLLRLFLPIVVFAFQLWFLLALKLCIPPQLGLSAGADAKLEAFLGGVELDAQLKAELKVQFGIPASTTLDDDALRDLARAALSSNGEFRASLPAHVRERFQLGEPDPERTNRVLPSPADRIRYYEVIGYPEAA